MQQTAINLLIGEFTISISKEILVAESGWIRQYVKCSPDTVKINMVDALRVVVENSRSVSVEEDIFLFFDNLRRIGFVDRSYLKTETMVELSEFLQFETYEPIDIRVPGYNMGTLITYNGEFNWGINDWDEKDLRLHVKKLLDNVAGVVSKGDNIYISNPNETIETIYQKLLSRYDTGINATRYDKYLRMALIASKYKTYITDISDDIPYNIFSIGIYNIRDATFIPAYPYIYTKFFDLFSARDDLSDIYPYPPDKYIDLWIRHKFTPHNVYIHRNIYEHCVEIPGAKKNVISIIEERFSDYVEIFGWKNIIDAMYYNYHVTWTASVPPEFVDTVDIINGYNENIVYAILVNFYLCTYHPRHIPRNVKNASLLYNDIMVLDIFKSDICAYTYLLIHTVDSIC